MHLCTLAGTRRLSRKTLSWHCCQKTNVTRTYLYTGWHTQAELEDTILALLSSATGSLLDNITLINTLDASKTTWEEVSMLQSISVDISVRAVCSLCLEYRACLPCSDQLPISPYIHAFPPSTCFHSDLVHLPLTSISQVNQSLKVAEETSRKIEAASQAYRPCSVRRSFVFILNFSYLHRCLIFNLSGWTHTLTCSLPHCATTTHSHIQLSTPQPCCTLC